MKTKRPKRWHRAMLALYEISTSRRMCIFWRRKLYASKTPLVFFGKACTGSMLGAINAVIDAVTEHRRQRYGSVTVAGTLIRILNEADLVRTARDMGWAGK